MLVHGANGLARSEEDREHLLLGEEGTREGVLLNDVLDALRRRGTSEVSARRTRRREKEERRRKSKNKGESRGWG